MIEAGAAGFFVFVFGLCAGSFLNVCIYRLPRGESVVSPGSHCPCCQKPVAWRDNIPLISYLALRGKCRHCGAKISVRYFVVELATAALWLGLWLRYGLSWDFAAAAAFISLLFALSVTDMETGYLPDKLTLPGMVFGIVFSALWPPIMRETVWYRALGMSCAGLLAGGGILLSVGLLGNWIFKRESMGGGDIKLLAMIGAFVGWQKVAFVFLLAPVVSVPIALYVKFVRRADTLPFGPYLAVTGAWFYFFGDGFIEKFFAF